MVFFLAVDLIQEVGDMLTQEIGAQEVKEPTHVDNFIDYGTMFRNACKEENEAYARWVLNYFRHSAILKSAFYPFMREHKLFCEYEGKKYRVIGASRMGDVWLAKDFKLETGYDLRVCVDNLSKWSKS